MTHDKKSGLSATAVILIIFTVLAMTVLGGVGVKALLDGLLRKSTHSEHISDEEAYKLCIFSQRGPDTCRKMIADRVIERVIEKNKNP